MLRYKYGSPYIFLLKKNGFHLSSYGLERIKLKYVSYELNTSHGCECQTFKFC